jgi:aryl-alcohol dehydrogenase-like predicted oxidoreductase
VQDFEDNAVVADTAARHGVTVMQVLLAWLLARSPVMLPIPGTGSVAHLEENTSAATIRLDPAEVAAITASAA